jgi:hypothetical protein
LARTGEAIRKILNGEIDRSAASRAGAAFLQAIIDTSFDLRSYDYVNFKSYPGDVVTNACDALETGLGIKQDWNEPAARVI